MKKKILFFAMSLILSAFIIPNASAAAKTLEYQTIGGKNILFANGTAIKVEAPTTAGMGATIVYEGGSIEVPADTTIFGGYHNNNEIVDSSIIMNDGTIKNIFGGGLHISHVNHAYIEINGGKITSSIMGGGYEEFVDCGGTDFNAVTEADVMSSTTKVETTDIIVNGGNLDGAMIFGGGGAHAYTETASITLNAYEGKLSYLIAGGSNGYTGNASIKVNNGEVGVVQSVNRGTMDTATITIAGGKIDNAYVGGETDPTVTGTFNEASMEITGGTVTNVEVGSNGVTENKESISAKDNITLTYNKDTVTNIDETEFAEDTVIKTVKLTFSAMNESETIEVPVGTQLTEEDVEELKNELQASLTDSGYTFEDFYADEDLTKKLDLTQPINDDLIVYMNLVQLREEDPKDDTTNPETSDIGLAGLVITILLAGTGLGYTIKKRKFN